MKHQSFTFVFIYLSVYHLFIWLDRVLVWHVGSSSHCADLSLQGTDSLLVVLDLSSGNRWA